MKKFLACLMLACILGTTVSSLCFGTSGDPVAESVRSPLGLLQKELLSFFTPVMVSVKPGDGLSISVDKGAKEGIREGMRLRAYKEGVPFVHPVTKERLGNVELPIGVLEITGVKDATAEGSIKSGQRADFVAAKAKIPATRVKLLFYQGSGDWYLGDAYYRMLQDSGRFELVDTGLVNVSAAELLDEARKKGAEVVLMLLSNEAKDSVELTQNLFWVSDGKPFSSSKSAVHKAAVKQLKFAAGYFAPRDGEALLSYKLPFSAERMTVGDFAGDGSANIVLASGNRVSVYKPDVDLKLLWEFTVPSVSEILWIDTVDANGNGRDEIVIAGMGSGSSAEPSPSRSEGLAPGKTAGQVISFMYELANNGFTQLYRKDDQFIRTVENSLAGQEFSRDGFEGGVYQIGYKNGKYEKGSPLPVPKGINLFDFQYVYAPDGRKAIFAWDENGYLHLYNDKGIRIWVSKEELGGIQTSFKKDSSTIMSDKGKWSIKDRLLSSNAEVLVPKRTPLLNAARGIGYSGSELRSFWWNGITVEERRFLEEMGGDILDYTVVGDRILVILKPFVMNQAKLILKGQSPFGSLLYVFSTKGR